MKEVPAQRLAIGRRHIVRQDRVAKTLTGAQHFSPSRAVPPAVIHGEIEQLERAVERLIAAVGPALLRRTKGSVYLATDVRQLLEQGECSPPVSGEAGVTRLRGHAVMHLSRIRGSSMDRKNVVVREHEHGAPFVACAPLGRHGLFQLELEAELEVELG